MIPLKVAANFIGTLLPVVFPNQEFKPQRLFATLLCFGVIVVSVHFLGVENTEVGLELAEDFIELTEE